MNLPAGGFQPLIDINDPNMFALSQGQGGNGYTGLPDFNMGNNKPNSGGFWSKGGGYQNVMGGLNALSGIAGAYTGIQQLGLAKDAFAFNKDVTNTNLSNQATSQNAAQFDRLQRQNSAQGVTGKYKSLDEYTANSSAAVSGKIGA